MSERRAQIHTNHELPKTRRRELLDVARSSAYYRPEPVSAQHLTPMRRIDEIHLRLPFYGSRRMRDELEDRGHVVNCKRIQRLMRLMGLRALYPRQRTSQPGKGHKIYKKYPKTAQSIGWQYVFPSSVLRVWPKTGQTVRWHTPASTPQRAFREALARTAITKHAGIHTLRHYAEVRIMPRFSASLRGVLPRRRPMSAESRAAAQMEDPRRNDLLAHCPVGTISKGLLSLELL